MSKILSVEELKKIDEEIHNIGYRTTILDPENPIEAKLLDIEVSLLDYYLSIIEKSYKKARILESGLRLITT